LLKHLELFSAPDCSLHALWRGQATEENAVVETSDYRSAAETRRNPLLQVKAGLSLWLAWNAEAMVSLPC
jgi:hypothetical protein